MSRGASTQIAFEPTREMAAIHSDDLTNVKLRSISGQDQNYKVFVTTFLGFGVNEARRRYNESRRNISTTEDPCVPGGLDGSRSQKSGDLEACISGLYPLLNKALQCPDNPCLFNGVHAPIEVHTCSALWC